MAVAAIMLVFLIFQIVIASTASAMNGPENLGSESFTDEDLTTFLGWMTNSGFTHNVQCCEKGTTATNSTCGNGGTRCEDVCNITITSALFVDDFEGPNMCGNSDGVMVVQDDEILRCSFCKSWINGSYCGPTKGGWGKGPFFICPGPESLWKNIVKRRCCKCKEFSQLKDCCTSCKSCQQYYRTNNTCRN
eukprot:GFUD01133570.1.p1 GENE.GFUD01133570.1~~GFUD01133570.1.p1  ORF type:complete len:210 (-),score=13.67 GFUD01133570.1:11-583(-)